MKRYPALDVWNTSDTLLALVDDFAPTAVEQRDEIMRLFFASPDARDAASAELRAAGYRTDPLDVSDEDWARRSQEGLQPVTAGRITVAPSWLARNARPAADRPSQPGLEPLVIVIEPSMGFGTGHHATTRLCLEALQTIELAGASVLDVGTGSGILAIAADLLGASRTLGVDSDADAIQSARENLALNPGACRTSFAVADLAAGALPQADVVAANLTGALLIRAAGALLGAVHPGGTLVLSGILAEERDAVLAAFPGAHRVEDREDAEWVALVLTRGSRHPATLNLRRGVPV